MFMQVSMRNKIGVIKQVKIGLSWPAFFFGGFAFIFRGMPFQAMLWILFAVCTFGISNILLMFTINKMIAHYYLDHGYEPVGDHWNIARLKWNIEDVKTAHKN